MALVASRPSNACLLKGKNCAGFLVATVLLGGGRWDMKVGTLLVVVASVWGVASSVFAQTINNPARNVFDTTDRICSGDDPSITFCDGFEDGTWLPQPGETIDASTDHWKGGASSGTGLDPTGRDYGLCGGTNSNRADFGAAGTPCTSSMGWGTGTHGRHGAHFMKIANGDPDTGVAMNNFYVRLYFKLSGISSTYCNEGYPNCPEFTFADGTNGPKSFEFSIARATGGITYHNFGPFFDADGTDGRLMASLGSCSGEANPYNLATPDCSYFGNCRQSDPFNYYDHLDEWIFVEMHIDETKPAGEDIVELWMDSCGADGLSCPETPTRRMNKRTLDLDLVEGCVLPDSLWLNWWQTAPMTGEIQHDEVVVRDGNVLDEPIGFYGATRLLPPLAPLLVAP